jgi:cardiolipin synthase
MMHGKLVVVDEHLSIIGSGNIDPRSFFINDENNVLVLDPSFARRQLDMHQADRQRSRPVMESDLRLSFGQRCKGVLGRLVQHQL